VSLLELVEEFGERSAGPAAAHSGNMGDILYALPTCAELGIERLVLNLVKDPGLSGRALTETHVRFLAPLLLAQPGLRRIEMRRSPVALSAGFGEAAATPVAIGLPLERVEAAELGVDHVLDRFRLQPLDRRHLVRCHSAALGCRATGEDPFLALPEPIEHRSDGPILLSLTPRYRFQDRAYFARLLEGFGPVIQVGIAEEAHVYDGLPGEFVSARDALELARLIASARLFVGSPSLPYAIAEGLKVPRIVDVPEYPLNAFPLGDNGWVLPADVERARLFLRAILDGTEHVWSAAWAPRAVRPQAIRVSVAWSRAGRFAEDCLVSGYLPEGDAAQLISLRLPPDAAADGLRLDIDTPHRGLLLSRFRLENEAGAQIWELDFDAPGLSDYFASPAAQAGNCHPFVGAQGLLIAKLDNHAWFSLPAPQEALAALAAGAKVLLETRPWSAEQTAMALGVACRDMRDQVATSAAAEAAAAREVAVAVQDRARAEALGHELAMLHRSTSWRLTRPLRGAVRLARLGKRILNDPEQLRRAIAARGGRRIVSEIAGKVGLERLVRRYLPVPPARPGEVTGIRLRPTSWIMGDYGRYMESMERQLALLPDEPSPDGPLFSIAVPVYNPDPGELRAMVHSVRLQKYGGWQLCLADDCSPDPAVRPLLESLAAEDSRIKLAFRGTNGHIAEATNTALDLATGAYVGFLDQDDMLHPACLSLLARHIAAHPQSRILYTDEDKLRDGARCDPYFKPSWSYTLFLGQNFFNHFTAIDRSLVESVGRLRADYAGAQDYDLFLRCLERVEPDQIGHVPYVLYHWRSGEKSIAGRAENKPEIFDTARRALADHLRRKGLAAEVQRGFHFSANRIRFALPARLSIGLCIDARGQPMPAVGHLAAAWVARHPERRLQVLVGIEEERVADAPENLLVVPLPPADTEAAGWRRLLRSARSAEVIISARARCLPADADAIEELASQARRPDVGLVGGLALDGANRIWHAGLILDQKEGVLLPYAVHSAMENGSFAGLRLPREMAAVAPYCLAMRSELLAMLPDDGPEGVTASALLLQQKLWASSRPTLWTPYARFLISGESLSALFGSGLGAEEQRRWLGRLEDPVYHPGLSRQTLCEASPSPPVELAL